METFIVIFNEKIISYLKLRAFFFRVLNVDLRDTTAIGRIIVINMKQELGNLQKLSQLHHITHNINKKVYKKILIHFIGDRLKL